MRIFRFKEVGVLALVLLDFDDVNVKKVLNSGRIPTCVCILVRFMVENPKFILLNIQNIIWNNYH